MAVAAPGEYGRLCSVLVKHVRDAFVGDAQIAAQWRALNYSAPPDLDRAAAEYDAFLEILKTSGAHIRRASGGRGGSARGEQACVGQY